MDRISLKQQFRKRTMKGVDGCKGGRLTVGYQISRGWRPSLRQRQRQRKIQRQLLLRRLQKRGETSTSMGARLPDPSHRLFSSTNHRHQRSHNSISPCFLPYLIGRNGQEIMSCISPFDHRSYTLGCVKEIQWHQITVVFQFGTCHPWIIVLLPCFRVALLNPISGHEITLPGSPISWSDYLSAPRFVLSLSHPHSSTPCYTVFIIFHSELLFCRKGDHVWTRLNLPWHLDSFNIFKGDLYALRVSEGARYLLAVYTAIDMFGMDTSHESFRHHLAPTPTIEKFGMDTSQLPSPNIHEFFVHHLVESPNGEELLLVLEIIKRCDETLGFQVFTADLSGKMWIRKETLGDHVLIIVDQQTLFLSAASVGHGIKGNCVYFSCLFESEQTPLKMFDLDSEKVTDCTFSIPGQFMFTPSKQLNCSVVGTRINRSTSDMISPLAKVNMLMDHKTADEVKIFKYG